MTERKHIWLVRHAESKAQTREELSFDSNLSELGHAQAQRLKVPLATIPFDMVFLSPLCRARQTFEDSGIPRENVVFDTRLIEELPAKSYETLLPYMGLPEYGAPDRHDAWTIPLIPRVESFLRELADLPGKNILILTHHGVLSVFLNLFFCRFCPQPPVYKNMKLCSMGNAAISLLQMSQPEEPDKLLLWNYRGHQEDGDHSYLEKLAMKHRGGI